MKQAPRLYWLLIIMPFVIGVTLFKQQLFLPTPSLSSPPPSGFNLAVLPTTAPPTPTPTPRPLTFKEMNDRYGPCVVLPVLMYHHIQAEATAKANNQTGISVFTDRFVQQMAYIKAHGYTTVTMDELNAFFNNGSLLPKKAVIITFDDGYNDNYTDAFPVLKDTQLKATIFLATGLMENPGYLSWNQIKDMAASGLIMFGNHTWSHKNMQSDVATDRREIQTAQEQLMAQGLTPNNVFAYPYGLSNNNALAQLHTLGYTLAFSTQPGRYLCEKQRLFLPRLRMSNSSMESLGF